MKQLFSLKYRCRVSDRSYEFTTEGKNEAKITLQKEKKSLLYVMSWRIVNMWVNILEANFPGHKIFSSFKETFFPNQMKQKGENLTTIDSHSSSDKISIK